MTILCWNCRGLNKPHALAIPYLVWLCRSKQPCFLFLSETKMSFADVACKLGVLNPSTSFGVDSIGSNGGFSSFWLD